jgi:hypothetical protein
MEDGVHRAGAELVTMPRQFLDHAEPEDGLLGGMMKDMEPDQPGIEILIQNFL